MKLGFLILAALVQPVLAGAGIQTNRFQDFNLLSAPTAHSASWQEGVSPWDSGPDSNQFALNGNLTNFQSPVFPAGRMPPAFVGRLSPPEPPKPGVYRTSRYTCLVFVPEPLHGEDFARQPDLGGVERMPTLEPDLQFIPASPDKK